MVDGSLDHSAVVTYEIEPASPLDNVVISCGLGGIKDEKSDSVPLTDLKPRWESATRELWLGDWLVKRLTRNSENQEVVLDVFEEMSWPRYIDDPLPPKPLRLQADRVKETCRRLNKSQVHPLMHFRASPSREVIMWEVLDRRDAAVDGKPR